MTVSNPLRPWATKRTCRLNSPARNSYKPVARVLAVTLPSNLSCLLIGLCLALTFTFVACESDAQRVRATNEAAPAIPTSAPTTSTFPTQSPSPVIQPTATLAPTIPPTPTVPPTVPPTPTLEPPPEPTPLSAEIKSIDVQDGDCIVSTLEEGISIETVVIVPCSEQWQFRALDSFEVPGQAGYPGQGFFEEQAFEKCDRRFTISLVPQVGGWMAGDRTVNCLQDSFGLSASDPAKLDRLVGADSLMAEECFNEAPETSYILVELLSCSADWEVRVLNTFTVERAGRFPGDDFFSALAGERCDRRSSSQSLPTDDTWLLGDRTIICTQDGFGLSATDPAKLDRLVSTDSLMAEECFNEAPETSYILVELLSCSADWEVRVLNTFTVERAGRFPGDDFFSALAGERCDRRSSSQFLPTDDTWLLGDRTIICLQGGFGLSATDPAKLDRLVSIDSLMAEECFNEAPETSYILVELLSCSADWEVRVLNTFIVERAGRFPGDDFFSALAGERCDRRSSSQFLPTDDTWLLGDRTIICLQGGFGLSATDPAKLDRLVSIDSLMAGECFNPAPEPANSLVEILSCSSEWEWQVVGIFSVPLDGAFPADSYFGDQAAQNCELGWEYYFAPTAETWSFGDRSVICARTNESIVNP